MHVDLGRNIQIDPYMIYFRYILRKGFVCLGFYAEFQFYKGDSSQIHASWTIFNQYLTRSLSWHWWTSRRVIAIILSAIEESHFYLFFFFFKVFGLSRPGIETMTSRLRGGRADQ